MHIPPKTTAIIGSGGKSTLLRALAEELATEGAEGTGFAATEIATDKPQAGKTPSEGCPTEEATGDNPSAGGGEPSSRRLATKGAATAGAERRARVIVTTSTKMFVPDWCPVLFDATMDEVRLALSTHPIVCVGRIHEPTGKLDAPNMAFSDLKGAADYLLVEADGAKMLPLKAHAEHEPVIPECAKRTVCVVGIDGVGRPISQACHRAERFARLAGVSTADATTPEMVARVLEAEGLHDTILINKVESDNDRRAAERIAALCTTPVVAGSLWRKEFRCLR
ncbi:selenium cofactor biosynthesis protein YqeC [uncultured Slackia sp.]|uniref:selenium cofactor biosynthesis protein YqeC n=1 Tax=uncultured Slackia sp. TaxID=665903 RepID=UPI0026DB0917|nr:selenium cofactor biosynthesis protein YqeC [uncultured Slackia sp.]